MLAVKFILLVISVLIGYFLGYFLTERYNLNRYDVFRFKAFECRPCLSFHISWVTSTFISLLLNDWVMVLIGIAFALMLWLGLYIDQRNKTISLEDYEME